MSDGFPDRPDGRSNADGRLSPVVRRDVGGQPDDDRAAAAVWPLLMPHGRRPGVPRGGGPVGSAAYRGRPAGRRIFARGSGRRQRGATRPGHRHAATRVIGISSGEPAGLGMNSSTMTAIVGGRIYPQAMFRRLLQKSIGSTATCRPRSSWAGRGPGRLPATARQSQGAGHRPRRRRLCRRERGRHVPPPDAARARARRWCPAAGVPAVAIPPIRGASTMGVVEISRGCGLGCSFCTIARVPMVHLPPETILADVADQRGRRPDQHRRC